MRFVKIVSGTYFDVNQYDEILAVHGRKIHAHVYRSLEDFIP